MQETYLKGPNAKSGIKKKAGRSPAFFCSVTIETNDLAVDDGVLDEQLGQRPLERLKSKVPLIARNQLRLAVLQVRDRPKTVVLQLENVVGMIEGLPHQTEPHRVNAREHNSKSTLGMRLLQ